MEDTAATGLCFITFNLDWKKLEGEKMRRSREKTEENLGAIDRQRQHAKHEALESPNYSQLWQGLRAVEQGAATCPHTFQFRTG